MRHDARPELGRNERGTFLASRTVTTTIVRREKRKIAKTPVTVTANELLLGEGEIEVDTFSLLMSLERALETNDGSVLAEKLQELELALEQVLKQRAFIGNTMRDLQEAQQKQEVQIFDQERRLSEIRDADLAESALHLKTAELNNRVSLDAGSRLIQPSLTDFLR